MTCLLDSLICISIFQIGTNTCNYVDVSMETNEQFKYNERNILKIARQLQTLHLKCQLKTCGWEFKKVVMFKNS